MRNLRTQVFIGVLVISLAACVKQAEPIAEPEGLAHGISTPQYSAEAIYQTTTYGMASAGGFAFNADGSGLLISSDQTGVFNAYRLSVDGADAIPLTSSSTATETLEPFRKLRAEDASVKGAGTSPAV